MRERDVVRAVAIDRRTRSSAASGVANQLTPRNQIIQKRSTTPSETKAFPRPGPTIACGGPFARSIGISRRANPTWPTMGTDIGRAFPSAVGLPSPRPTRWSAFDSRKSAKCDGRTRAPICSHRFELTHSTEKCVRARMSFPSRCRNRSRFPVSTHTYCRRLRSPHLGALPLPLCDLVRVDIELLGVPSQRLVALQRCHCHFGLEGRRAIQSPSSHSHSPLGRPSYT